MAGFVAELDRINRIADESPGFVWRLQTEAGNATAIRAFEDERILFNMSVWESIEALHRYVYRSDHAALLRHRKEWFEPFSEPVLALWWVASGHRPTVEEAKQRLQHLADRGPTPEAFTFKTRFPSPGVGTSESVKTDFESCESV